MRLSKALMLTVAGLQLSTVHSANVVAAAQQEAFELSLVAQTVAERPSPRPEAYNTANPIRLNITVKRDSQCKNCPWDSCLNSGIMWKGTIAPFQCWTQGETVGDKRSWLRYQIGPRPDEFCYVTTYDLEQYGGDFTADLPYCGTKSEMMFYLPSQKVKTIFYTECSICPYRDCEGTQFYQAGTTLYVNCQVTDGWNQLGPLHPNGTRKYYRTPENCYVSVNSVEELPAKSGLTSSDASRPGPAIQELLPPCGPIPLLLPSDRLGPGIPPIVSPPKSSTTPPKPVSNLPNSNANAPQPSSSAMPKASAPSPRPVPSKQTTATPRPTPLWPFGFGSPRNQPPPSGEEEDEDSNSESRERVVTIVHSAAPCRSCADVSCGSIRRYKRRDKQHVLCSENKYLRTKESCFLKGTDTNLGAKEVANMPKCRNKDHVT